MCRYLLAILAAVLWASLLIGPSVGGQTSNLKVILLGSGAGPPPNPQRFGPSILVEAGDEKLLFDCGRAATIRLAQLGIRLGEVSNLFVTHLHSDHVIGIPDLFLTGWGAQGRRGAFRVWGPKGTREMMDHIQKAFEFDIRIRRDVATKFPKEGIRVSSTDIEQGVIFQENGVTVTAFLVDHGPVKPAFGYRVDYGGHSVAMSGDTRFSENLIRFAQGVDLLIHEATDPELIRARLGATLSSEQIESIIDHHTTAEQAGVVFARVKPRLAVYSHIDIGDTDLISPARKAYSGPLEAGEDLMTIEIADQIDVRRFTR